MTRILTLPALLFLVMLAGCESDPQGSSLDSSDDLRDGSADVLADSLADAFDLTTSDSSELVPDQSNDATHDTDSSSQDTSPIDSVDSTVTDLADSTTSDSAELDVDAEVDAPTDIDVASDIDATSPADTSDADSADADTGNTYTAEGCLVISLSKIALDTRPVSGPSSYNGDVSPALGGAGSDLVRMEFYSTSLISLHPGVFNLADPMEDNYATCIHCVRVFQDWDDTAPKYYFQESGTMELTSISVPPSADQSAGSLTDVKLVESTFGAPSGNSSPVIGGECLFVPSAAWDTRP